MMEEINIEKLRNSLIDYFETAIASFPLVIINLNEVYNACEENLIKIVFKNGFNLENYISNDYQKKKGI